mmetsp:Transcript_18439/g.39619  ORF Transcript_18439/g.39619 Transcript_18439/m.39619 type:complete len:244 (-) Transcript_18439:2818-3549(-)
MPCMLMGMLIGTDTPLSMYSVPASSRFWSTMRDAVSEDSADISSAPYICSRALTKFSSVSLTAVTWSLARADTLCAAAALSSATSPITWPGPLTSTTYSRPWPSSSMLMRFFSSWAFIRSMCSLPSFSGSTCGGASPVQSSVKLSSMSTLNDWSSMLSSSLTAPTGTLLTISTTPDMIMKMQCASSPSLNRYSPGTNIFSLSRARIIDTSDVRSMASIASFLVTSMEGGGALSALRHTRGAQP